MIFNQVKESIERRSISMFMANNISKICIYPKNRNMQYALFVTLLMSHEALKRAREMHENRII